MKLINNKYFSIFFFILFSLYVYNEPNILHDAISKRFMEMHNNLWEGLTLLHSDTLQNEGFHFLNFANLNLFFISLFPKNSWLNIINYLSFLSFLFAIFFIIFQINKNYNKNIIVYFFILSFCFSGVAFSATKVISPYSLVLFFSFFTLFLTPNIKNIFYFIFISPHTILILLLKLKNKLINKIIFPQTIILLLLSFLGIYFYQIDFFIYLFNFFITDLGLDKNNTFFLIQISSYIFLTILIFKELFIKENFLYFEYFYLIFLITLIPNKNDTLLLIDNILSRPHVSLIFSLLFIYLYSTSCLSYIDKINNNIVSNKKEIIKKRFIYLFIFIISFGNIYDYIVWKNKPPILLGYNYLSKIIVDKNLNISNGTYLKGRDGKVTKVREIQISHLPYLHNFNEQKQKNNLCFIIYSGNIDIFKKESYKLSNRYTIEELYKNNFMITYKNSNCILNIWEYG